MTSDRRAQSLSSTIEHLDWCVTIHHTIDQVIGIYAERTRTTTRPLRHGMTNDEILSALVNNGGTGGKGGHSDPTARAALWGEPDATDDDETVSTIAASVALCHETAVEIAAICGTPAPPPPDPTLTTRIASTLAHVHRWRPVLETTASNLDGDDLTHLDTLVRVALGETAQWLHHKAEGIWLQHRGERMQVAQQKPIEPCRLHAKWVRNPPHAAPGRELCQQCTDFQERHRCEPTEPIIRRWEYGSPATPGQIVEAKASKRSTVKRDRKATA